MILSPVAHDQELLTLIELEERDRNLKEKSENYCRAWAFKIHIEWVSIHLLILISFFPKTSYCQ